jgi:hypothetical protein
VISPSTGLGKTPVSGRTVILTRSPTASALSAFTNESNIATPLPEHQLRVDQVRSEISGSDSWAFERSGQIGDEIIGILDADRVANEIVFDADEKAFFGRKLVEAHQRRLLDQTLHTA